MEKPKVISTLPNLPPDEPSPESLPPFFWLMLRGCDLLVPPKHPVARPSKIILLHGWLQDHSCWLKTATKLRHTFGHDVLLIDFYGHGHSPYLKNFYHMNIFTSMRQLRKLVEHVCAPHESSDTVCLFLTDRNPLQSSAHIYFGHTTEPAVPPYARRSDGPMRRL
eukprot:5392164-Pyramimonas_sp.AAC.2